MKCKKCGHEMQETDLFCCNCGEPVAPEVEIVLKQVEEPKKKNKTAFICGIIGIALPVAIYIIVVFFDLLFFMIDRVGMTAIMDVVLFAAPAVLILGTVAVKKSKEEGAVYGKVALGFGIAAIVIGGTYSIVLFFNIIKLLYNLRDAYRNPEYFINLFKLFFK